MQNFIDTLCEYSFPLFALATIFAVGLIIAWAIRAANAQRAEFMAACMQDRKEYECVAMWRAGSASPVLVPVYVR